MIKLKSGRLGSKKTSTGCKTCKIRRIKCDENRPTCGRCTSTGRKCDGYDFAIRPYYGHALPPEMRIYGNASGDEVRLFEYFLHRVVPGFTRVVDEEFWHVLVPRFCHMDQCVWNAVSAFSVLFQAAQTNRSSKTVEALTFYQKSLKLLQKQTEKDEWTSACELTAIIYICIECLQDNAGGAKNIYLRVVNVLQLNTKPLLLDEQLVRGAVVTLLRHMALSQGAAVPLPQVKSRSTSEMLLVARDNLHELIFKAHRFVCSVQEIKILQKKDWCAPEHLVASHSLLLQELKFWNASLPGTSSTQYEREIHAVLMLVYHQYYIWLSTCLSIFETAYDDYFESFEAMLNHAHTIISSSQQSFFSFETRVIPSLFFVAIRCRNPQMRRRAVSLLQRGPQKENTHDAKQLLEIARKAIGIEEAGYEHGIFSPHGCDGLPPEPHRIHRLLELRLDGKIMLDIGGWNQCEGQWSRVDYLVKL